MNVNSIEDIIKLLMRRDNISLMEAQEAVNDCKEELDVAICNGLWQQAEDILKSYLSLEPDYLDIFINELF